MLRLNMPVFWQKPLTILAALILAFAIAFWQSWLSIISIWYHSTIFTHGFLVLPASLWLIWNKRELYLRLRPEHGYWAISASLACGFVWLASGLVKVLVLQQFALVGMLICLVWSVLGNRIAIHMSFPLGFLFLMVPFGEDFIPFLMDYTANFVVWMLRLTGISVYQEGLHFTLTSGSWSVVEACSGIRYLIASLTLGAVYAYLNFNSYTKRIVFITVAIVLPILANGLRAYLIVMMGHLSSMKLATGVDHLIYGWVFFGLVMLLLFYAGSFWADPAAECLVNEPMAASQETSSQPTAGMAGIVTLCCLLFWPFASEQLRARQQLNAVVPPALVQSLPLASAAPEWGWHPQFKGTMAETLRFVDEGDGLAAVYFANFGDGTAGGELVNSQNTWIIPAQKNIWRIVKQANTEINWSARRVTVDEAAISGEGQSFLAMRWYRIGKINTANSYYAEWLQLLSILRGDAEPGLLVVIYTPAGHGEYRQARERLQKLASACCG
jgi:exosortase A